MSDNCNSVIIDHYDYLVFAASIHIYCAVSSVES